MDQPTDTPAEAGAETAPRRKPKVARMIEKYDLSDMEQFLRERYMGIEAEQHSLRQLARSFNEEILKSAMVSAGMDVVDTEVKTLYDLLTDEESDAGEISVVRTRLEQHGLDPDEIMNDFVSHMAIRSYLQEYLELSRPDSEATAEEKVRSAKSTIGRVKSRSEKIAEKQLEILINDGIVTGGPISVSASFTVRCAECNEFYSVREFIENGGCDCNS
ncbi:MAG: rod-determining factor RdfA [archaeon]